MTRRAAARRRPAEARTYQHGQFQSVRSVVEPLSVITTQLQDATNLYCPDPQGGGGFYARPGLTLEHGGAPLIVAAPPFRGQGIFSHTSLAGVTTNFVVMNGTLLRVDASRTTFTDVTPVGVVIDAAITTRVFGTSFADQLIVTDGVHRPWVASNLSSTPITGTYLDFDGAGTVWTAFGPGEIYAGSIFFILNTVNSVAARTDIAWSGPGDVTIGYQQPNYDFRWTLEQTSAAPLFGLKGENTQLYYWRESSIGSITGTPGPNLRGQATHDAISTNVGTLSPQSIVLFGDAIFFTDAIGRSYRLQSGSRTLDPLWLTMRSVVDASTAGFPSVNQVVCTATFEPTLNWYLVAPWSSLPSQSGPPTEAYIFDARTGAYFGRFRIADGAQIDCLGVLMDASGIGTLIILGSAAAPSPSAVAASGYLWSMNSLVGVGEILTTEAGVFLTTEDGRSLSTEGSVIGWEDNGAPPILSATTQVMGYDPDLVGTVDRATVLVGSTAPCIISMATASMVETAEGTPTPSATQDGIGRLLVGSAGIQGRGVSLTIAPTTALTQWSLHGVSARVLMNVAAPDEP